MTDKQKSVLEDRDEILSNLKFLGLLTPDCKVNLNPRIELVPNSWGTAFYRSLFGSDDRMSILSFARHTIDRAFTLLIELHKSKLKSEVLNRRKIVEDLQASKTGLMNVKTLYKSDLKLACDLDLLAQTIDSRLLDILDIQPDKQEKSLSYADMVKLTFKPKSSKPIDIVERPDTPTPTPAVTPAVTPSSTPDDKAPDDKAHKPDWQSQYN